MFKYSQLLRRYITALLLHCNLLFLLFLWHLMFPLTLKLFSLKGRSLFIKLIMHLWFYFLFFGCFIFSYIPLLHHIIIHEIRDSFCIGLFHHFFSLTFLFRFLIWFLLKLKRYFLLVWRVELHSHLTLARLWKIKV